MIPHFDGTITIGNLLTFFFLAIAILKFWSAQVAFKKDLEWRIGNLETWRKEHMIDADARDKLLKKLDRVCDHLEWLVNDKIKDNERRR